MAEKVDKTISELIQDIKRDMNIAFWILLITMFLAVGSTFFVASWTCTPLTPVPVSIQTNQPCEEACLRVVDINSVTPVA